MPRLPDHGGGWRGGANRAGWIFFVIALYVLATEVESGRPRDGGRSELDFRGVFTFDCLVPICCRHRSIRLPAEVGTNNWRL
jgi:hypothetical protein